jgi:hypothetical protein
MVYTQRGHGSVTVQRPSRLPSASHREDSRSRAERPSRQVTSMVRAAVDVASRTIATRRSGMGAAPFGAMVLVQYARRLHQSNAHTATPSEKRSQSRTGSAGPRCCTRAASRREFVLRRLPEIFNTAHEYKGFLPQGVGNYEPAAA